MTLIEFKAWFGGFVASMGSDAIPSQEQWSTIKREVASIEGPTLNRGPYLGQIGGASVAQQASTATRSIG